MKTKLLILILINILFINSIIADDDIPFMGRTFIVPNYDEEENEDDEVKNFSPFVRESTNKIKAKNFIYWLNNIDVEKLNKSSFDLVIIDYFNLTLEDIEILKSSNKTLLCYLNISQINSNRLKNFSDENRDFIFKEVENSNSLYVKYWLDIWFEDILKLILDEIVELGFDGIYLDGIKNYEKILEFEDDSPYALNSIDETSLAMIELIENIKNYLIDNDEFLIFAEDIDELFVYDNEEKLMELVDGVGVKNLFFEKLMPINPEIDKLKILREFRSNSKTILVTDFFDSDRSYEGENLKRYERFKTRIKQEKFLGYGAYFDKKLDRVSKISEVLFAKAKDSDRDYIPDYLDYFPFQKAIGRSENTIFNQFNVGVGGRTSLNFKSKYSDKPIWLSMSDLIFGFSDDKKEALESIDSDDGIIDKFKEMREMGLKNAKFLTIWITRGWQRSWFNLHSIEKALEKDMLLVVNYAFYLDFIATKNAKKVVLELLDEYRESSIKLGKMLGEFKGTILVVLEPEFNKSNVKNWAKFGEIIRESGLKLIRENFYKIKPKKSLRVKKREILFGIAITDSVSRGKHSYDELYVKKSLGDNEAWSNFFNVIYPLNDDLDFIAFQEMIGQFSRNPKNPSKNINYDENELGMSDLYKRVENFSRFLNLKFHHPVYLPYIALATGTWSDNNSDKNIDDSELNPSGWDNIVYESYSDLMANRDNLKEAGLFGLSPMMLFDNPSHDFGKYQFFRQNEYFFGLLKTNAKFGKKSPLGGNIEFKRGENGKSIFETIYSK